MIAIPEADLPVADSLGSVLARGIPRAYAVLFFSANTRLGWFLLAISLIAPDLGLVGLAGVCAAGMLAWVLGFERANIRNGYLLFNPLLVCLTLAWLNRCYHFEPAIYAILFLASVVGGFFLSTAMQHWVGIHFNLSTHSLPAVAVAYVLYFLGFSLFGGPPMISAAGPHPFLDLNFLPPSVQMLFQAFGAMLFQPYALPGLLVFAGLTVVSPLTSMVATLSVFVGAYTMSLLGYPVGPESVVWCGFNFLLCGIALGSGYFVVSLASLALALAGSFLCALLAISVACALRYFGLPPSALPYNLVVLVMVYALKQRRTAGRLHLSPAPGSLPESAARLVLLNARRFPDFSTPALYPPFEGVRTITQGFNGKLTHRGAWGYALDFEFLKNGEKHGGPDPDAAGLDDFYTFNTPVLSPCAGVVAAAVSHVKDNAPGSNNADENWGNHVILYSDAGYYVLLAHLKEGSVTVFPGQRVPRGAVLGHCGNSGRSPVPHLHMHIQNTIHLGTATRPFCLKHYIERSADERTLTYKTSGVPATNACIQTPAADPVIGEIFAAWLPGEYRYRITGDNGASWEESFRLDFDELGSFRMLSHRCEARLTGFLSENVFYTTNYQGNDGSLLAFIAVGLARVPCVDATGLTWHDHASAVPFFREPFRWLQGLLDPFLGPSILPFVYSMQPGPDGYTIRCVQNGTAKTADNSPREITTRMVSRRGVSVLEARLNNDRVIRAEQVHYETL